MDQIISFDKSLQLRMEEYESVFFDAVPLPYSKIQREWSFYLELALDPCGWQAIWKIPRNKCEELKITYPTMVLVYVLQLDYPNLSALVRILAVQDDDINLPDKHTVPLIQLWPTKAQDKSIALNLHATANSLDMLKFFYLYLVMPWDEDEDSPDWKRDHLVSRLRFFYDQKNGKIPKGAVEHIYSLINEAKRLSQKRKQIASICDNLDDDIEENAEDENIQNYIAINVRLMRIQHEVSLLENETFRNVVLKEIEYNKFVQPKEADKSQIWIVSEPSTAGNYLRLLSFIEAQYPTEAMSFVPNLMEKLLSSNPRDTILLNPTEYKLDRGGILLDSICVKGIGNRDEVRVVSLADEMVFDLIGDSSVIENVSIDCKNTHCAILVRTGHVSLKNCKLMGNNVSSTTQGIVVLNGAKLSLISCDLSGFSTGLVGNTGSEIEMLETLIHSCNSGVKVYDNCQIRIQNSIIKDCEAFGIIVQTDQDFTFDEGSDNSFELLKSISYITSESINGSNNGKGNVAVKQFKIKAVEDLFENPDLDPTIIEDSDVELEDISEDTLHSGSM